MKCSNNSKPTFDSLDVAKLLCSLLIIVIHTAPLAPYSPLGNFYLCNVLARVAVPLFFAISGFLFSRKANVKKQIIRIGTLYLIWSAVYLIIQIPEWHRTGWWGPYVIKDYIVSFITQGSYYHLWYLLATLYALPLLYILMKYGSRYLTIGVCALFWVIECLTYSYTWIGIDYLFPNLVEIIGRFSAIANALFRALPLMLIGLFAGENYVRHSAKEWGKRAGIAFCFAVAEASLLYFLSPNGMYYSYLFTTPVVAYCTVCFLLSWDFSLKMQQTAIALRNASLTIYCMHPFVYHFVQKTPCPEGIPLWMLVTIISVSISLLAEWVRSIYQGRKLR